MRFSSRERFLIGLLMLSAIWAAAYKVCIGPGHVDYMRTMELLDSMEQDRDVAELYLSHYEELERQLDTMEKTEETDDFFFKDIDDAYMDRNLQDMAERAGVTIGRMSIGQASARKLPESTGGRPSGDGEKEETADSVRVMEIIITMEVESPDAEGVMAFADELYREHKSLSLKFLDMESEYSAGEDGQEVYQGMKGIMEVRYAYEEVR